MKIDADYDLWEFARPLSEAGKAKWEASGGKVREHKTKKGHIVYYRILEPGTSEHRRYNKQLERLRKKAKKKRADKEKAALAKSRKKYKENWSRHKPEEEKAPPIPKRRRETAKEKEARLNWEAISGKPISSKAKPKPKKKKAGKKPPKKRTAKPQKYKKATQAEAQADWEAISGNPIEEKKQEGLAYIEKARRGELTPEDIQAAYTYSNAAVKGFSETTSPERYADFQRDAREIANERMEANRTQSVDIGELRLRLLERGYSPAEQHALLEKMKADGKVYFNEHSHIASVDETRGPHWKKMYLPYRFGDLYWSMVYRD